MHPVLPPDLTSGLQAYLTLLERWNRIHALTALPAEARWEELVLDSAALLPHLRPLPPGAVVGDFGTGMGMPAVLVAMARPDLRVLALDKAKKKLAFVAQAALELGLGNLEPRHGRFEDHPPLNLDAGCAKALASVDLLRGWWTRHGQPGAPFFALKTAPDPSLPAAGCEVHPYDLPTRGHRAVVTWKRGA